MTYENIKRSICKRQGDPDLQVYRGLAGEYFVNAMCDLIAADEYQEEDIPELFVDDIETSVFTDWEASFEMPNNTLKFIDAYLPTATLMTTDLTLKETTHANIQRLQLEPAFRPTKTECFWYRIGKNLKLVLSQDFEIDEDVPTEYDFVFAYVKNPEPENWTTSIDMINDLGYGRDFLYTCIKRAVGMLSGISPPEGNENASIN